MDLSRCYAFLPAYVNIEKSSQKEIDTLIEAMFKVGVRRYEHDMDDIRIDLSRARDFHLKTRNFDSDGIFIIMKFVNYKNSLVIDIANRRPSGGGQYDYETFIEMVAQNKFDDALERLSKL
jgi:hypothetical protein